jgi:hypothetical protein
MKTRFRSRKPSGRTFDRSAEVFAQHDPETAA